MIPVQVPGAHLYIPVRSLVLPYGKYGVSLTFPPSTEPLYPYLSVGTPDYGLVERGMSESAYRLARVQTYASNRVTLRRMPANANLY